MRVSGKITHSFYLFLHRRGFDISRLFELTSLEMEFLKDPDQWMDIFQVEAFLKQLEHEYSPHFVDQDFLSSVGHSCPELGAWGELDSVLKMKKTEPVFSHFSNLPVFLSYFISDGFSLVNDRNETGFLSFKCNLSSDDCPCVTEYIRSALEALPVYADKPRAEVKWIRNYIQIKWEDENSQTSLFPTSSEINIKPELLTDLRQFLEKVEKEAYYQRQQIREKDKQIRNLKDQLLMQGITLPDNISSLVQDMENTLLEMKKSLLSKKQTQQLSPRLNLLPEKEILSIQADLSSKLNTVLHSLYLLKDFFN